MMRSVSGPSPAAVFDAERPRLVGLAYRMLGSVADAEDVVQEAWLRWAAVDPATIDSPPAWLTTVVSRLSLDQLRRRRRDQERYVGPWLPEPLVEPASPEPGPAARAELADSLTTAFLLLLEQLSPTERAVVLLTDVFGEPFDAVAQIVGKSPAATRQVASRARRRLRAEEASADTTVATAPTDDQREVARAYLLAALTDDKEALLSLLADDVVVMSDGGPDQHAARRPVIGPHRVARFSSNLVRRFADVLAFEEATVNGNPGVVGRLGDAVAIVVSVEVAGGRVQRVTSVLNPDKLRHVDEAIQLI